MYANSYKENKNAQTCLAGFYQLLVTILNLFSIFCKSLLQQSFISISRLLKQNKKVENIIFSVEESFLYSILQQQLEIQKNVQFQNHLFLMAKDKLNANFSELTVYMLNNVNKQKDELL
eukprot:TRINITY_DN13644_c0_g1_i4.p3 TRINITY_DN13644_c0_g1~~TRINITY_DN13644_c0_g1_i4.p3  ORF type:complete len:119 (+),score=0.53 TRINITY_DN13644_c0_g1_i4:965-1321(+)